MTKRKYVVLGESKSDAATIKVLIRKLSERIMSPDQAKSLTIRQKGYNGCADLLTKGARDVRAFYDLGFRDFVVHYDSDGFDPETRREELLSKVLRPALRKKRCLSCALIPVQETEAWILADLSAVVKVIPSWRNPPAIRRPETIPSPKEHLRKLSEDPRTKRPRYNEVLHNHLVSEHLDLCEVERKCGAFRILVDFVCGSAT